MRASAVAIRGLLVAAVVSVDGNAQRPPRAADVISAEQLRGYLSFIASDVTEGRGTPSRGLDVTAEFIASHLRRLGARPGGDSGTFFQRVPIIRRRIDSSATWGEVGGRRLRFGDDFTANVFPGTYSGDVVYVGHGWVIKARNIDAYAGLDVRNKIVVLTEGLPPGVTRAELTGRQGQDYEPAGPAARRRGALAQVIVPTFQPLLEWKERVSGAVEGGISEIPVESGGASGRPMPVIRPSLGMLQALLDNEPVSARVLFNRVAAGDPPASFALSPGKHLTMKITARIDTLRTQNVIGVIEGSDPKLKDEYVVVSAHYDHLGVDAPVNGDAIYNGADDNGSGTAALLGIAEAFAAAPRPRRSILFVWHAAEENRDAGSRYLMAHPTVPLNQIVADLNIDMIGRTRTPATDTTKWTVVRPGEVYVMGAKLSSRELGDVAEAVNRSYLGLSFNYRFDTPDDPRNLFARSDQYSYFEKGIPALFYYTGDHEDYHQPSDSMEKIDFQNMEKIARTVFATAFELANRSGRPRLDAKSR